MEDMNKMLNVICEEIDKIADKGLTTSNLDTAYKLIDMYKDLKTVGAMEEAGYSENYEDNPMSYRGYSRGNMSEGRQHYVRGHYSRDNGMSDRSYADQQYSQAKMAYRNSRAGKQDVMESLNQKMRELRKELQEMSRDSDFPEERKEIDKYVEMINNLM